MADKIKSFIAKKKADAKFKLAGPGHKLSDTSSTNIVGPSKSKKKSSSKTNPTEATKQAAQAALARISQEKKTNNFNTSLAAIQARVRRELESEHRCASDDKFMAKKPKETMLEASPHLAATGVYFRCPLVSDAVLTKDEWKPKIQEFLFGQVDVERGLTSCLIIHTCNYNRVKVTDCVSTLCKYLDNIIANPDEVKFHKIRCLNATYMEKVQPILGSAEFLEAAGFHKQMIDNNGQSEESWIWSMDNVGSLDVLKSLRETLSSGERVELEIDRNTQVLSPSQASTRIELPQDFYAVSPTELKREQQLKHESLEKQLQLRTKAMRERDELKEIRKYKFCIIRIRFPDGLYLQGTFSVYEKFCEVLDFVRDNLDVDAPFELRTATGQRIRNEDEDNTLLALKLVPATILMFKWDRAVDEQLKASGHNGFLRPDVMKLMQPL
ncbi:UBX domain-containing protein 6-like [Aethina tumida]|uniref:UBX domain-containing protein 6-like n=1 Tax=Aethina tumida TaxID=116153 RepID=UPI00096ADDAD|nr:UBX domain-containing protein 6-like [Aethina tumida]